MHFQIKKRLEGDKQKAENVCVRWQTRIAIESNDDEKTHPSVFHKHFIVTDASDKKRPEARIHVEGELIDSPINGGFCHWGSDIDVD